MLHTLLTATLLFLPAPIADKAETMADNFGKYTIESLDIPWDPGDIIEANAVAPPEPEPEPEIKVELEETPILEETSRTFEREATNYSEGLTTTGLYGLSDLQFQGVIWWNGNKFTYYSESVLPGGGLAIPGRHVNSSGFVADANGYISLAAGYGIPHGTVFETPFGAPGKVYDTCASCSPEWLDVYTR